jgi:acyl-CoA synthetase (NDP forming)
VLAADALAGAGIPVDPLPAAVQQRLRAVLPGLAGTGNPVDASAAVTAEQFERAVGVLLDAPEVGAVVTVTVPTAVTDPAAGVVAAAGSAAQRGSGTPLITVQPTQAAAVERCDLPGSPAGRFLVSVADPCAAARALAVARARQAWLARGVGEVTVPARVDVRAARDVVDAVLCRASAGDWLLPPEVGRLAAAAPLATVPSELVPTAGAAAAVAHRLGGPVAVKGFVRGVLHKGDAGLLRLPMTDPAEVGATVTDWVTRAGDAWLGAVVQPFVAPGDEFLVGAVRDPAAGAVVTLGPGGRATDALGHRVHRLAPPTEADVAEMLASTGLFETVHGAGLDRRAVGDCVRRVAWLADAVPEIAEIEVNPLVVTGPRARALDVRVRVAPRC